MAVPAENVILMDSKGCRLDLDTLVEHLRRESTRILADDEVGVVVDVAGLGIYRLTPTDTGEWLAQPVTEISRPRFSTRVVRKQIGAIVLSVTADAIFIIRDGDTLKKVRAEKLRAGMVLATGEKVYQ